jgi:hypothetical protein
MGTSWRRRGVSQTSIVACVILFIVVLDLVTEAQGESHKRRHYLSTKRRSVGLSHGTTSHRWPPLFHRGVGLSDAVNLTVCSYTVSHNVKEGRVPRVMQHVKCVTDGCRCKAVNSGTYKCRQLVTSVLVMINNEEVPEPVYYACVCASASGKQVPETSSSTFVR